MENKISKIAGKIFPVVAFAMSVYHLWQVMMPSIDPTKHMDIHLAFALSLVFLSAMIIKDDKHSGRTCLSQIASICFLIMALVSTAYIFVNFNALLNRAGRYTGMDLSLIHI